jgi:hypothetical protein
VAEAIIALVRKRRQRFVTRQNKKKEQAMLPNQVRFTGMTLSPLDLLYGYGGRKANYVPPSHWLRIEVDLTKTLAGQARIEKEGALGLVDSWIEKNMTGKWISREIRHGSAIVVFFEDEHDALMFKLLEGDTASLFRSDNNN